MAGAPVVAAAREEAHRVAIAPNLDAVAIVRLISWTQSGPADGLAVRVGMQGGTKPVARDMPLYYRRRGLIGSQRSPCRPEPIAVPPPSGRSAPRPPPTQP
jgi:hypothetical protein